MGTRFSRRTRRRIPATEQTLVASISEASPTFAANGTRTETDVAGTVVVGHAQHQIPAPEQQTLVASNSEASPTFAANGTRAETDAAGTGTGQGSSQPGECRSIPASIYKQQRVFFCFFLIL